MKKMISLLLIIIVVAGCNKEKIYKENLEGTWQVYKYLLYNVDKTQYFESRHPNYSISFTTSGGFTETEINSVPDTIAVTGTYSFEDNDEKLVLSHFNLTYRTDSIGMDTLGYTIYDTLEIRTEILRKYTIFNLSKDHVQLRNDTSQLYMNKKEE
ncbi:MAG: membrane lipoprotein lipid attachment site-containing protein [Bacteroidota bacterium]